MSDAVVDACCLINLYAAGDFRRFLATDGFDWHVPTAVMTEALFVRVQDESGEERAESMALTPLVDDGLIAVCAISGEAEAELYVRLSTVLDDGEAMALAIAKQRGWTLATDDVKAQRYAGQLDVPVLTTPDLMRRWADANELDARGVRAALRRIQASARFMPRKGSPMHAWWARHVDSPPGTDDD